MLNRKACIKGRSRSCFSGKLMFLGRIWVHNNSFCSSIGARFCAWPLRDLQANCRLINHLSSIWCRASDDFTSEWQHWTRSLVQRVWFNSTITQDMAKKTSPVKLREAQHCHEEATGGMDIPRTGGGPAGCGGPKRNRGFFDPSMSVPLGNAPFSGCWDLAGRTKRVGGAEEPLADLWFPFDCSLCLACDNKPNQSRCARWTSPSLMESSSGPNFDLFASSSSRALRLNPARAFWFPFAASREICQLKTKTWLVYSNPKKTCNNDTIGSLQSNDTQQYVRPWYRHQNKDLWTCAMRAKTCNL